jgi:hypothetical protein
MDIYVGNLAYSTADDDLKTLFAQHGTVASARAPPCPERLKWQAKSARAWPTGTREIKP